MRKDQRHRIIFNLGIREDLRKKGFEPLLETDNLKHPGFKCWVYENTPEFAKALDEIMEGRKHGK